jgi:hypothetical protein
MASTMPSDVVAAPLHRLANVRPRPAKALIEVESRRARVGEALRRAIGIIGLSDKEAADVLCLDKSQLSRWLSGHENIQLARLYGTRLYGPFVLALAHECEECEVETTVRYRRLA